MPYSNSRLITHQGENMVQNEPQELAIPGVLNPAVGRVVLSPPSEVASWAKRVRLTLLHLGCARTTEEGHDEVCYIIGGVDGSGNAISGRGPYASQGADADDDTAWDMNDSGDKRDRDLNAVIYDGPLAPGQSTQLLFVFYESDGTDVGAALEAAGSLASKLGVIWTPLEFIGKGLELIGSRIPSDSDDVLGRFGVRIHNDGGTVKIEEVVPGASTLLYEPPGSTGQFVLNMTQSGGNYWLRFEVRGVV